MAKGKKMCPFASADDCNEKLKIYFEAYLGESGEIADVESLADFLGVTREELISLKKHAKYGRSIALAFLKIAKIKKQMAFCGKINASVLSFDLRNNHGYLEKSDGDGEMSTVVFRGKAAEWAK